MKINIYAVKKVITFVRRYGIRNTMVKSLEKIKENNNSYQQWYLTNKYSKDELARQKSKKFDLKPKFSILVPVYNTPIEYLREMIDSVLEQTYGNWELCIANASPDNERIFEVLNSYHDSRIKIVNVPENEGISQNTNAALNIATGDYIALLDHDDLLEPEALFEYTKCINGDSSIEALYSDEDKVMGREVFSPNFKPDFNKELLRSGNYICHFFATKRAIADAIGGFRKEYNGAQDYDFIFRATREAEKTAHIPRILYHWRIHKESTADNPFSKEYAFEAGLEAISDDLITSRDYGIVEETENMGFYNVRYEIKDYQKVLISVFAKSEKSFKKYKKELEVALNYPNFEIEWNKRSPDKVIQNTNYEYILFVDEGIKFSSGDFLTEMMATCNRKEIGAVSIRLNKRGKTLHGGLKIGDGTIKYLFNGLNRHFTGYMHRASITSYVRGATISCLLVKKAAVLKAEPLKLKSREAIAVNWALFLEKTNKHVVYRGRVVGEAFFDLPGIRKNDLVTLREYWKERIYSQDPFYNDNLDQSKLGY